MAAWFRSTADGEVHGVEKEAYWSVIDLCYLCDLNFMTKCPFVPPHPWQMDFPHLMLRAKAIKFSAGLEGEVRPTHRKPANATHWWR